MENDAGRGPAVRVTIDDVARAAGVSRQTVSRAMNGKPEISATTRRRVLATIEELDYRPSVFARGMRTQRPGTLALVLSDIANPFFPAVARGVFDAAAASGLTVVVHNTDARAGRERAAAREIVEHGADGVIGFFEALDDAALIALDRRLALVVADRATPDPAIPSVSSDFAAGIRAAVDHLRGRGHTELAMLDGGVATKFARREAFVAALAEAGVPDADDRVVTAPATVAGGQAGAAELLAARPRTTAIVAFNDLMAVGAVRELRRRGTAVGGDPDACAVVGFDDVPLAAHLDPPLTTVHTDKYELGRTLVEVLTGVLARREDARHGAGDALDGRDAAPAEHRVLPSTLVVRASG